MDPAVRDPAAPRRAAGAGRRVRQPGRGAPGRGAGAARRSIRPTRRRSRSRASSATCARRCASSPATTTRCSPRAGWRRPSPPSSTRRATASTRGSPRSATRRLRRLIARGVPRRIGAYGWVDDLAPSEDPTPPTTAGFLHAPGSAQAVAAAVLRDHAVNDDDDARWQMNVRSDLARLAARLGGDVRLGVHISEALGREIERRAGDPATVLELRRRFPARPEWAGRRVCDGQGARRAGRRRPGRRRAARRPAPGPRHLRRPARRRRGARRRVRARRRRRRRRWRPPPASARRPSCACSGPGARARRCARPCSSRCPPGDATRPSPVTVADPSLAALLESRARPGRGVDVDDRRGRRDARRPRARRRRRRAAPAVPARRARRSARSARPPSAAPRRTGGPRLDRLCSLLGVQEGLPDLAGGAAAAETELRGRLAVLRAAADELAAGLAADPPATAAAARRWGLPDDEDAAGALAARIAAAGDPAGDATADAPALGERIRALLAPAAGLPLVCTAAVPPVVPAADLDRGWLEIVAAVRPAVARLEAHQLRAPWPAACDRPGAAVDACRQPSQRDVVVYGPGARGGRARSASRCSTTGPRPCRAGGTRPMRRSASTRRERARRRPCCSPCRPTSRCR